MNSPPAAQIGSLEIFWPLIEPILADLAPRRICEIGIAAGALTDRLLGWSREWDCAYVGIDPAPEPAVRKKFETTDSARQLLLQTSLAAFPELDPCDAYFVDGDHNYFTVSGELREIAAATHTAATQARGPIIFLHDVGWPWARRDLYYLPTSVPDDARHPSSDTLGVALDCEELIEGGMREPGRYAIALEAGGPRNGVLTAVENFLQSDAGTGWSKIVVPVAYGLGVLYRPDHPALPAACRARLEELRNFASSGGEFLQACEENFLRLYFYGEFHRHAAATERIAHHGTLTAYGELEKTYRGLQKSYADLFAHSEALADEYQKLRAAYEQAREGIAPSPQRPVN